MKVFSNEYINDFEKLKNAVVGFEFEFYTDRSYYKLLELLNNQLKPITVAGYRKYHSSFKPDENNFKIEPDLSGGPDMVELITGPMPYVNAKIILLKIVKILQDNGYTDEKCSLHINVSFDKDKTNKTIDKLNRMKLLLEVDEDYIYSMFPERVNNIYAKSVKNVIPFKGFDYSNNAIGILINNLELPDTKYYGINIKTIEKGRLEWRYIGGKDYILKTTEILTLMDYFISITWNCIGESLSEDNMKKLKEYLFENINNFKTFSKLEDFIAQFPTINVQVDKMSDYAILKAYYENVYEKIYDLVRNVYNLKDCIINLDTQTNRLEIVDASFKTIFDIDEYDLIETRVNSGRYNTCNFISSEVVDGSIHGGEIIDSDIVNCKLEGVKIDNNSEIKDSYLYQCFIDGHVTGQSIIRSCKLGANAVVDDSVKIVTDTSNYFNTSTQYKKGNPDNMPTVDMKIPKTKGKKW